MWLLGGRHGPGGRRGFGFPPGPFGFPPFGGGPWGRFGRGSRARRGDVRAGILLLLDEQPLNGYQIIQELSQRSDGAWRPSPGSIYPALAQLSDENLVRPDESGVGKVFELTDEGRAYVAANREQLGQPWNAVGHADHLRDARELFGLMHQVGAAAMMVMQTGTEDQVAQVRQILTATRKSLYRMLAEDDPDEG
ncbi:MAG TPA: PadR family transcriptional regulator [Kofleriaceae bacterium]|nr:PadR family transcriptional regulator [Kofleriaceae bacterium]